MHVVILAAARHPLRQPFAGGLESLTWALVRGLRERGVDVTLFAGPGSDPALGARELAVSPLELSDAARADVSMPPEPWLREHHAYLQVMLELRERHGRRRHPQQQPALPPARPRPVVRRARCSRRCTHHPPRGSSRPSA